MLYIADKVQPLTKKIIEKQFNNYYSSMPDKIDITYKLWHGYSSLEEIKQVVKDLGYNEEMFIYISLDNQWNAVTMENLNKQLVLNKDIIYLRNMPSSEILAPADNIDKKELAKLTFNCAKIGSEWNTGICCDLYKLFSTKYIRGNETKKLNVNNCFTLLGTTMFDTMIPVFKLNVMDEYLNFSPSRCKLWKKCISKYNYYTKEAEYTTPEEIARMRAEEENKKYH